MQANEDAGFALGEDAPRNLAGRHAQEAKWAGANVDARVHYSVRELLAVVKMRSSGCESDCVSYSSSTLKFSSRDLSSLPVSSLPHQPPLLKFVGRDIESN